MMAGDRTIQEEKDLDWLIDSGATSHMTWNRTILTNFKPTMGDRKVDVANGVSIQVMGTGDAHLVTDSMTPPRKIRLTNVLYVPELMMNLISIVALDNLGISCAFKNGEMHITHGNQAIMKARRQDNAWKIKLKTQNDIVMVTEDKSNLYDLWHERFGHSGGHHFSKLHEVTTGLQGPLRKFNSQEPCEPCIKAKQVKVYNRQAPERATRPLQRLYIDIWGKYHIADVNGHVYFLTVTCDNTRMKWVKLGDSRASLRDEVIPFIRRIERLTGHKVAIIRMDNAKEFILLATNLKEMGIGAEFTVTYSPDQNGVAERLNRTLVTMAKSMLFESRLPEKFWGFAIETACYLRNRLPVSYGRKTPYEKLFGKKPDICHLKVFGCLVFSYIPAKTRYKMEEGSRKAIFVGYTDSSRQYLLYDPAKNEVFKSSSVIFFERKRLDWNWDKEDGEWVDFYDDEEDSGDSPTRVITPPTPRPMPQLPSSPEDDVQEIEIQPGDQVQNSTPESSNNQDEEHDQRQLDQQLFGNADIPQIGFGEAHDSSDHNNSDDDLSGGEMRRSNRTHKPNRLYPIEEYDLGRACAITERPHVPQTYQEAITDPKYSREWKEAIQEELQAFLGLNAWTFVDSLPTGRKAIRTKWVFKVKYTPIGTIERFKARLVARGFGQVFGEDYHETFAPTMRMDSLRMIIVLSWILGLALRQCDVITAYLTSYLNERIYMWIPEGLGKHTGKWILINRAMYGLKQSAREWYEDFSRTITEYGLSRADSDWSLFLGKGLIIGIYVDDMIIASKSKEETEKFLAYLRNAYSIKDLGEPEKILGIRITMNAETGIMKLDQKLYIEELLKEYSMQDAKPVATPVENYDMITPARPEEERANQQLFQKLIGSLLWLALCIRIDICFGVCKFSQFAADPTTRHWNGLMRILRYLKGTVNYGFYISRKGKASIRLLGYSDADFASSKDRVSTSGFVFMLGGTPISWSSTRQRTIATSTVESEYIAINLAAKQAVWLRNLIQEMASQLGKNGEKIEDIEMVTIMGDNLGSHSLAVNPQNHAKTKHIDIQYHYIRHLIERKDVIIDYCPTTDMLADGLTKPLPKPAFEKEVAMLFGFANVMDSPNRNGEVG